MTSEPEKTAVDFKQITAVKAGMPADRQRLIYAGHTLKDDDTLLGCKIANGEHCI